MIANRSITGKLIRIKDVPRSHDDEVLLWLKMRRDGLSTYRIAKELGLRASTVENATEAVVKADVEESGEFAGSVRKKYWLPRR